jgi:cell division protein FtsB
MSEISERDFGRLEAEVQALKAEIDDIKSDVKSLLALANKSKGGFWMGMTIASIIGGCITFFVDRIMK